MFLKIIVLEKFANFIGKLKCWSLFNKGRSSHQRCSVNKKVLLETSQNSQKNTCARVFFDQDRLATLLKRRLWHMCTHVNFAKFLKTLFLQNTSGRLLLKNCSPSDLQHRFSPVKFAKFLRTPFFTEHLQWLLLTVSGFQSATLLKRRSVKDVFL